MWLGIPECPKMYEQRVSHKVGVFSVIPSNLSGYLKVFICSGISSSENVMFIEIFSVKLLYDCTGFSGPCNMEVWFQLIITSSLATQD